MILGSYLLSCFICMGLLLLQTYLTKIGYININPFEAMNKIREIIDNEEDPKIRQLYENFLNAMMQSPIKFQLAVAFCPLLNIIHSIKTITFILKHLK